MTTKEPIRSRGGSLSLAVVVLLAALSGFAAANAGGSRAAALPARSQAFSYGWPVKPFDRQHPVRGFFGDPRIGLSESGATVRQFHFGIDVSAPNGTAVYATLTGTAYIDARHADVVEIVSGSTEFSYWHIVPAIRHGARAVAYRTLVGYVEKPWAHVHFSERVNGVYLNPLRPGALGPYFDPTRPTVRAVSFERDGTGLGRTVAGRVDLVAEVFDETPLPVPAPWAGKPVMPPVVRWRLRGPEVSSPGWRTAVDFRRTIPDASLFESVYAKWTRQNHASVRGRYRLYLARGLDTTALADGVYVLEVVAADAHGHSARLVAGITVRNAGGGSSV